MLEKKRSVRKKVTAIIVDKLPKIVSELINIVIPIGPIQNSDGGLNHNAKIQEEDIKK